MLQIIPNCRSRSKKSSHYYVLPHCSGIQWEILVNPESWEAECDVSDVPRIILKTLIVSFKFQYRPMKDIS